MLSCQAWVTGIQCLLSDVRRVCSGIRSSRPQMDNAVTIIKLTAVNIWVGAMHMNLHPKRMSQQDLRKEDKH